MDSWAMRPSLSFMTERSWFFAATREAMIGFEETTNLDSQQVMCGRRIKFHSSV